MGGKHPLQPLYPPLFCDYLARLIFSATTAIRSVAESWAASHVHPAEALSQVLLQANQTPLPEDILAVLELLPHGHTLAPGAQSQARLSLQAPIGSKLGL